MTGQERDDLARAICPRPMDPCPHCVTAASAILASDWLRERDQRIKAEALREAQSVIAGEDPVEWARTAATSRIALSHVIDLLDDLIEMTEDPE